MKKIARLLAVITFVGAVFMLSQNNYAYAATQLVTESFSGSSTQPNQWLSGGSSCLTAGSSTTPTSSIPACSVSAIDTSGNGVLRLTNNTNNQSGFVLLNQPISTKQGFRAIFDMYQYQSGANHADGIGFLLVDGSKSPTQAGGFGPALGYGYSVLNRATGLTTSAGIEGGYAGIGSDAYGNYAVQSCGNANYPNSGCTGFSANTISIRGSEASGYKFIESKKVTPKIAVTTPTRAPAKRTVTITVSPSQLMNIWVDYHDGNGSVLELKDVDLSTINGAGTLPDSFKIGFSASTGGSVDYHEIQSLIIETLDPDLSISLSGPSAPIKQGDSATFTATVSNHQDAAPTTGLITATFNLPIDVVPQSVSGSGWACGISGQLVTCSRPGNDTNSLGGGASAPDISIVTKTIPNILPGTKFINGIVETSGDTDPLNDSGLTQVEVVRNYPDLTIGITGPSIPVVPGSDIDLVVNVSNAIDSGLTTDEARVFVQMPPGIDIRSIAGNDWVCDLITASCVYSGTVTGGEHLPPIRITALVSSSAAEGQELAIATVSTSGDQNASNNRDDTVLYIVAKKPDLSVLITSPSLPVYPGDEVSFTAAINNNDSSGPTTDLITTIFDIPAVLTIISASGDGWQCSLGGQKIVCTRPGSGADALASGQATPLIVIKTKVNEDAKPGSFQINSTVATNDDSNQSNNNADALIEIATQDIVTDGETPSNQPSAPNTGLQNISTIVAIISGVLLIVVASVVAFRKHKNKE